MPRDRGSKRSGNVRAIDRYQRKQRRILRSAIARIELAHDPFKTEIHIDRGQVVISIQTADRDEGRPTAIVFTYKSIRPFMNEDDAIDWIYSCLREIWVHELNEKLLVDGKRRRDLHRNNATIVVPPEERALEQVHHLKRLADDLVTEAARFAAAVDRASGG